MLAHMNMRLFTLPLLLVLAACGGQVSTAKPESLVTPSPTATASSVATPRPGVPSEFTQACGRPGSRVEVQSVPVTVRHADCDLSGVSLSYEGVGAVVPKPGGGVGSFGDAGEGGTSRSAIVTRDKMTKDVTFTVD